MREIEASWGITIKIWWAWTWRSLIVGTTFSILFGICFVLILRPLGVVQQNISALTTIMGFVLGLLFGLYYLKKILGKQFKNFRIAIIRTENN